MLTFLVGLGGFDHCIATTVEAFTALLDGPLALGDLLGWLAVTTAGNIVGGVMIVAAINYGQVREEDGDWRRGAQPRRADAHRLAHLGEGRRGDRPRLLGAGGEDPLELGLVGAQLARSARGPAPGSRPPRRRPRA